MMTVLKYVVVDKSGIETPLLFQDFVEHSTYFRPEDVFGAGFVSISENGVCCYGKSMSLGRQSRGDEDSTLIAKMLDLPMIPKES